MAEDYLNPEKTGYIYGLKTADSRIMYIGSSRMVPEQRLRHHRKIARAGAPWLVHEWMRQVGVQNVALQIIERCPLEDLIARERHFTVALHTSTAEGGLNERIGRKHSDKSRAKTSESLKDYWTTVTAEARASHVQHAASGGRKGGAISAHNRWHRDRGLTNPNCAVCTAA